MTEDQLDIFDALADEARARRTDPITSHEAAASVKVRRSQEQVLAVIGKYGPCTHEQLIKHVKAAGITMTDSGVRSRCHELVEAGLVVDTGEKGLTQAGRKTTVWAAA